MSFQGLDPSHINRRLLFFGIFLTSLSGLVLEIAITRIFSAAIWYHFAFVAVSVALVGLGASGLVVHYRLKKIKENWAANLTISAAIGIALIIPLSLVVMHTLESQITYLPLFMLLFAIPFFFVGIVISAAFSAFAHVAGKLYASDLIGASIGAIGVVLFLVLFGGEGTMLLVGVVSSICAVIFSFITKDKRKVLISIAAVVFALSLLFSNMVLQEKIFSIPTDSKTQKDLPIFLRQNPGTHIVKTQWNSFSRIDVVEGPTGNCEPRSLDPVFGQPQCAGEGLVAKIFIDGGAGTNVISWDGDPKSRKDLSSWMQYMPFKVMEDPKILVIGSGGGRDVVAALASGSTHVTSVEINPIIFDVVKSYGDMAGNVYTHKYVDAHVDEGRSFVSKSTEKYDIIYIPFVDTWASVSSGGLGVSENFLYTVEGFQEYYDHLTDNGKIVAVRWLIDAPRFVSTFATILEKNGVPRDEVYKHILIVSSDSTQKDPSVTMAILSKKPFTQEEIDFLAGSIYRDGYKPILVPDQVALEPYSQLLDGKITLDEYYSMFPTKSYPVTDDSPYFLSFEKPLPKILETLLYISIVIAAVFLVGPYLWLRKKDESDTGEIPTKSIVVYFAALGAGFILIELALMQKLILLLGNPTMTFAILLFTMLLSSGIGSLVSSRLAKSNTKNLTLIIGGIAAVAAFYVVAIPPIIYSVIAEPFVSKTLISVGILIPIGFLMGMPMPTGMRVVKMHKPTFVPWMWAINGAFSVLGAVLSVVVGIMYGASYAMMLGASSYLVALGVSFAWKRRSIKMVSTS